MTVLTEALNDLFLGARRWRAWHIMAMEDLRLRYRRTVFGVLWLTATFSLFIAAKSFVFSGIMPVPFKEYTLYMATSFLIWGFLSSSLIDSCMTWINAESWLRGVNVPKSIFVFQLVWRNLVTASFSAIAVAMIFLLLRQHVGWHGLISIAGLGVLILNAIWVSLFFGIISTRYRDIVHLIRTFMGIMFFVTPILWIPETMGPRFELFALYNPFAHFLALVRDPLVYGTSDPVSWIVCGAITVVGWVLAIMLFSSYRNRLVLWF